MKRIDRNPMGSVKMPHGGVSTRKANLHHGLIVFVEETHHFPTEDHTPEIEGR
jgi:hypothetical protein